MNTSAARRATTSRQELRGRYALDPEHTRIGFVARHAMVTSVRGSFTVFEGEATFDGEDPTSWAAHLTVQTASIATGAPQRDDHLRSADFFEADRYPEMTFTSTRVQKGDEDTFLVTGDLTIKDVVRPVTVEFVYNGSTQDPDGVQRAGFEGHGSINRKDWGLSWNAALDTGGVVVSDRIRLELDVSAVRVEGPA